jgi:polysaccharide export outer membrane protein
MATLLTLSVVGTTSVPASAQKPNPPKPAPVVKTYKIAIGDLLQISAPGISEIGASREVIVAPDGRISLPLVGQILASGLTLVQLETRLKQSLDKFYLKPGITVGLLRVNIERFVNVVGPGDKSGRIPMKDGWRVLDALAAAGSVPTERLEFFKIELLRGANRIPLDLKELIRSKSAAQNQVLKEDDTILITAIDEAKRTITVSGFVQKTGQVLLPSDGSLATVISNSGGFLPTADRASVQIEREGATITVDLTKLDQGIVKETLQIGDKIFVPENKKRYYVQNLGGKSGEAMYPDDRKVRLSEVLANAGLPPVGVDLKKISVTRVGTDGKQVIQTVNVTKMVKEGDKSDDMDILPGDTVTIPPGKQGNGMQNFQNALWVVSTLFGILTFIRR